MVRKCSHCGHNGHNSRTCTSTASMVGGGVRLFGVQLHMASPIKKSFSMDCLSCTYPACSSSSPSSSTSSLGSLDEATERISNGYLSDGLGGGTQERKKGVPWTEEEHRSFLAGLEKLGKGDWRGISRNFVTTRTPTQVASHAQKYFLRQNSLNKKKRRSSLFDVVANGERAAHKSGSSKSEDNSFSELLDPILSLTMASQKTSEAAPIDLNLSSQGDQEIQLPSYLNQIPDSTVGPLPQPSPLPHLDLELRMSSKLNQANSSPGNLYLGSIRATQLVAAAQQMY